MTTCITDMPSYTSAVKGQRLLRSRGYPCIIKRREKDPERGCGFSLNIGADCQGALKVLDMYGIPYSVRNDGDEGYDKL